MKINTAFCAGVLLCSALSVSANSVYLVRHAEKQPSGADPALTACGQARAQALAASFADIKLAAIYTTPFKRTQQTAAAVAQSQQLKVQLYDPREAQLLVQLVQQQQQPVLVVGHSNTVPQLVTLLSGFAMATIDEQEYGLLYQVNTDNNIAVTLTRQPFTCNE
jgi:2,3-bisphosphoglycerate-dependent phosphoglycerate mutase